VPEFIGDLPLHALVTHFVVVLLPVAVVGAILTAIWPWVRRRFGWLVVVVAAVAAGLVPVATNSGTNLKNGLSSISKDLGDNPLVNRHEELANLMLWWALGLFAAVTLLMIVHEVGKRRTRVVEAPEDEPADFDTDGGGGVATATRTTTTTTGRTTGSMVMLVVLALVTIGVAAGTGVHVYRVGDAGAKAVWLDVGKNIKQQEGK
jgi:uncharacterized membrane protein